MTSPPVPTAAALPRCGATGQAAGTVRPGSGHRTAPAPSNQRTLRRRTPRDRLRGVRRLRPDPVDDVDLAAAYAVDAERHVRANFVSSLDGAVALFGKSAGLSSDGDRALFHVLRTLADVVLVGAGTARGENYGGAKVVAGHAPPIAVVSRSLEFDYTSRLFTDTTVPPIVVTCDAAPKRSRDRLAAIADVVVAGDTDVDLASAVHQPADLA